jgi:hypothetical protein
MTTTSPLGRIVAIVLCACMLASATGCGARSLSARRLQVQTAGTAAAGPRWITREYAEKLPVGTKVKVERRDGQSFSATFMGVDGDAVRVQKRTRLPEPPVVIPLEDLAVLALDNGGGIGSARAALVGVGTGAATFFFLLLLAAAAWD